MESNSDSYLFSGLFTKKKSSDIDDVEISPLGKSLIIEIGVVDGS